MGLYDILKKWTDPNSGNLLLARKIAAGLVRQHVLRMLVGFNEWWIVDTERDGSFRKFISLETRRWEWRPKATEDSGHRGRGLCAHFDISLNSNELASPLSSCLLRGKFKTLDFF